MVVDPVTLIAKSPYALKYGVLMDNGSTLALLKSRMLSDAQNGPLKAFLQGVTWTDLDAFGFSDVNSRLSVYLRNDAATGIGMTFSAAPDAITLQTETSGLHGITISVEIRFIHSSHL